MKKILFLFLISFLFSFNIKADDSFYLGVKVPDMYVESIKGNEIHNGAPFLLHRSDGAIVYCINPFKMMSTTEIYKSYLYNDSVFGLTDEQLNKLNIISYYGYGYTGHNSVNWFGITQYYMWKSLDFDDVYFTDSYYGKRVDRYTNEVNELERLVNDYYKLPSFAGNHYEYNPNATYQLLDTNNVLSNYVIKESSIKANISGNKLIIDTDGSGNYNITFVRKSPINRDYILYNLEGSQSLIYPGKIKDITFTISITVNSGSITINKLDCENKSRLEATLDGSIFSIYKDNSLVRKITVDKTNKAFINNLPLGNYVVKEETLSKGYEKDSNEYNIAITKTNKDILINSCSNVINGNLIINKYYGEENNYNLDSAALFEIYHNGNLIRTINNQEKVKLEYGTYLVKQISGKKYYDLIGDFNFSVIEDKDYKYDFYTDKTDEIKAYEELLNKREESLDNKEKELIDLENKIKSEKDSLVDLKNEIENKENELDEKKAELIKLEENLNNLDSELKKEKEELEKLKDEISKEADSLEQKKEELENKEHELKELNEELNLKKEELENKEDDLKELEDKINNKIEEINILKKQLEDKEKELNELKNNLNDKEQNLLKKENDLKKLEENINNKVEETNISKKRLEDKEKELLELKNSLNEKEQKLNLLEINLIKKEDYIKELENKKEDVLIVEVPNTSKKNYNNLISAVLIIIGIIFIIYGKKKVTE